MKQRLASPTALVDLKSRGPLGHLARRRRSRDRRHGPARRRRRATSFKTRSGARALAGLIGDPDVRIGARSAVRSPTTIPPPTIRPPRWRSARPSSPTSAGSRRKTTSRACLRRRSKRRTHHPGQLSHPAKGRLREVPQSGVALRDGRRVRREDGRRRSRRRDRRRLERRLPRKGDRGGAGQEFLGRRARRRLRPATGSIPIFTPTPTIAPTSSA